MLDEFISMLTSLLIKHPSILIVYKEWLSLIQGDLMPVIIVLSLITLMLLEIIWVTCFESKARMLKSYLTNLPTFVFNNVILSALSISSLLILAERYQHNGLLSVYGLTVQTLFAFILFDLTLYLWHQANHKFDWLWMFHKVHHSDKSMNSTTAFRVHVIEVLLSSLVKALFILVTGVQVSVVVLCESVATLFIMFHHLNLPIPGEKWLKCLFIVPILHRIHHSPVRKEHDSNYGAIFSLWDRMFRTLNESGSSKSRSNDIGLTNVKALNFYELLKFGFFPGISDSEKDVKHVLIPDNMNGMVAEAAYYIAEKRGFAAGNDQLDWYTAEQQIYIGISK